VNNAILEYYKQTEQNREKKLMELLYAHCGDSFLIDEYERTTRLFLKKHDDEYHRFITAEDIYDEFIKINNALCNSDNYSTSTMLIIMEKLLEDRYISFKNVYDRLYKEPPKKTIAEFLARFEVTLSKLLNKLNIGYYEKGFSTREQDNLKKHLGETYCYLLSIGKWKLADDILECYNKEPLTKPISQRQLIADAKKTYAEIMLTPDPFGHPAD
jgi:hypothetical protein